MPNIPCEHSSINVRLITYHAVMRDGEKAIDLRKSPCRIPPFQRPEAARYIVLPSSDQAEAPK